MRYLVVEALLRLAKVGAATLVGVLVYWLVTGPLGHAGSAELFLLAWLVGAGFVLLVESSPI
ncbi:MAG: hypothetical protein E6I94_02675 [Chloroflexi bacterium]|nr:MAG: hypothetical protein E6I94_02675 [Chloroflexota bacterium]